MATINVDMKAPQEVRASAILTNSYVAGNTINASSFSQLILLVKFTLGSLTSAQIKVEFSNNGTDFYQETFSLVSGGTSTDTVGEHSISTSGNYRIAIPVADLYVRVSAKGTGTVTGSLMEIDAVLATQ